jgi:hypothetical protein
MNNPMDESLSIRIKKRKAEEEFEKKFFPRSHERKKREKVMKEPKLFEEELKKKLRKCLIKE